MKVGCLFTFCNTSANTRGESVENKPVYSEKSPVLNVVVTQNSWTEDLLNKKNTQKGAKPRFNSGNIWSKTEKTRPKPSQLSVVQNVLWKLFDWYTKSLDLETRKKQKTAGHLASKSYKFGEDKSSTFGSWHHFCQQVKWIAIQLETCRTLWSSLRLSSCLVVTSEVCCHDRAVHYQLISCPTSSSLNYFTAWLQLTIIFTIN